MAMHVEREIVGVDVSKAELVVYRGGTEELQSVRNAPRAIEAWLKALAGPVRLALEATGRFHVELLEQAHALGHEVYLIDGYRLARYREGVGGRAKTDASDARLLARYLAHEQAQLRAWTPPPKGYGRVKRLLRQRAKLVQLRVSFEQSLAELPELGAQVAQLRCQLKALERGLERELRQALGAMGKGADAKRCAAIEGIGPLTAAALTNAFQRAAFASADAFVAFLGLDVRVRDSGTQRGRRRLTKKGDPELRRLLYLAAMKAKAKPAWAAYYQRHIDRGLAPTQAILALARKLARVAFALLKNGTQYRPRLTCPGT